MIHQRPDQDCLDKDDTAMDVGSLLADKIQYQSPVIQHILDSLCYSNFDGPERGYLPEQRFREIVYQQSVERELRQAVEDETSPAGLRKMFNRKENPDNLPSLARWVCNSAPKTFAIAIQCSLDPPQLMIAMFVFRQSRFTDKYLPVLNRAGTYPSTAPWPKEIWTPSRLADFYDKQWKCLVPNFSEKYDWNLKDNCIFPFNKGVAPSRNGSFSSVQQVTVHPQHQVRSGLERVAIKEIQMTHSNELTDPKEVWEHEALALSSINSLRHKHVIECVAAIRRGESRYFMFPWADGESLRNYWESTNWTGPNADIIHQAIEQLRGLSDALVSMHNGLIKPAIRNETDDAAERSEVSNPSVRIIDENDRVTNVTTQVRSSNIRHGDLKPENILRFDVRGSDLGTLKLADMGLAKQHFLETSARSNVTKTKFGTIRYEPPEVAKFWKGDDNSPRSRLYDIWSIGCITLEFVIWILYGIGELERFYEHVKGTSGEHMQFFQEVTGDDDPAYARLHPVVRDWINHIESSDPECTEPSAVRDLIRVVKNQLLVVPLPPQRESMLGGRGRVLAPPEIGESTTRYRATALEFRDSLDAILEKVSRSKTEGHKYLFLGGARNGVETPSAKPNKRSMSNALSPTSAKFPSVNGKKVRLATGVLTGLPGRLIETADYSLPPLKNWQFNVDNRFAESVKVAIGCPAMSPSDSFHTRLCSRCTRLDFWGSTLQIDEYLPSLLERAKACDFCGLIATACQTSRKIVAGYFRVERKQSNLVIAGDIYPVLSIVRSPGCEPSLLIQLGIPQLPKAKSQLFFDILKLWLHDCMTAEEHKRCRTQTPVPMPTRLIDVGKLGMPQLRLMETNTETPVCNDYIALSHPWGNTKEYEPFKTLRKDYSGKGHDLENFKRAIPYKELPKTFRHAVRCTRELGIRYLWIDSICIVQGLNGDFNEEAKKMEDVFSGACCVLAASRARDQRDGFLGTRPQREFVTFHRGNEEPFYVCNNIDNFDKDVIRGSLNKRGWVLQERALARRTIYFTETQAYFECGQGVRCETLTKLQNHMSDFLGDSNFPEKTMLAESRALKISYFQDLYKRYSRLDFTRYEDRPYAIAGLEKRLQKAFGTKGGFGIFDDGDKPDGGLFHRSLLWQRGEQNGDAESLSAIEFPADRHIHVPSWSWMAYNGGIDYADPPWNAAIWEKNDITPPWTRGPVLGTASAPIEGRIGIVATVRDFNTAGYKPEEVKLTYDTERRLGSDGQRVQCVIVARSRDRIEDQEKVFYVLLVTATQGVGGRGEKVYLRAGAGRMLGKFISLDGPGIAARIE